MKTAAKPEACNMRTPLDPKPHALHSLRHKLSPAALTPNDLNLIPREEAEGNRYVLLLFAWNNKSRGLPCQGSPLVSSFLFHLLSKSDWNPSPRGWLSPWPLAPGNLSEDRSLWVPDIHGDLAPSHPQGRISKMPASAASRHATITQSIMDTGLSATDYLWSFSNLGQGPQTIILALSGDWERKNVWLSNQTLLCKKIRLRAWELPGSTFDFYRNWMLIIPIPKNQKPQINRLCLSMLCKD